MPLSAKQMEYLAIAWLAFESEPKIDYTKFHRLANLASPHCAREMMRVTKNKLLKEYGNGLSSEDGVGGSQAAGTKMAGTKKSAGKAAVKRASAVKSAAGEMGGVKRGRAKAGGVPGKARGVDEEAMGGGREAGGRDQQGCDGDEDGGDSDGEEYLLNGGGVRKKIKVEKEEGGSDGIEDQFEMF